MNTTLTTKERLLIGGLGALTPQLANLLVVDLEQVLSQAGSWAVIGYIVRVLVLFGAGVFVAYLHDDETNKVKAFQFGMAAPAMLLATLNGAQVSHQAQPDEVVVVGPEDPEPFEPIDPDPEPTRVLTFSQRHKAMPSNSQTEVVVDVPETTTQQVLRGMFLHIKK